MRMARLGILKKTGSWSEGGRILFLCELRLFSTGEGGMLATKNRDLAGMPSNTGITVNLIIKYGAKFSYEWIYRSDLDVFR